MKRNFIHLPFNMLFYLILKNSKNGVLYGLNKEHVNFIAHHETKFSHGVAQAGSGHCQVAVRVQQPRQGRQPEAGLERLAASFSSRRGAVPVTSSRFPPASVNSFFASLKEKNRGDFLSATSHFFNRQM